MKQVETLWCYSISDIPPMPGYVCPANTRVVVYTALICDVSGDGGNNSMLLTRSVDGRVARIFIDQQAPGFGRTLLAPVFVLEAGDSIGIGCDSSHFSTYGSGTVYTTG